jgi:hypothetical protein
MNGVLRASSDCVRGTYHHALIYLCNPQAIVFTRLGEAKFQKS